MTKRTNKQNKALHVYIRHLAEKLDAAGYDMKAIIRAPIHPTEENCKETMIHPVMRALYPDVESTADLTTEQMQVLYETMNRFTAERFGISVDWPQYPPPRG